MIARATVRPPMPESKTPIGAVLTPATLRQVVCSAGERRGLPARAVGLRGEEGGEHTTERAEQVRLPRDAVRARQHAPEDAAPERQQYQADEDLTDVAGEHPAHHEVGEPAE